MLLLAEAATKIRFSHVFCSYKFRIRHCCSLWLFEFSLHVYCCHDN